MRILFLDIDGVMVTNTMDTGNNRWACGDFDQACVRSLNRIIIQTGCEIVISSDWRSTYTLKEMRDIFEWFGVKDASIIGYTPNSKLYTGNNLEAGRSDEILQWIGKNAWKDDTRWCAVDDMNMDEQLFPNFVRCVDDRRGISDELVADQIIKKLRG